MSRREKLIIKNENRCRKLSDTVKHNNCIIGIQEEEREMRAENLFGEIMT